MYLKIFVLILYLVPCMHSAYTPRLENKLTYFKLKKKRERFGISFGHTFCQIHTISIKDGPKITKFGDEVVKGSVLLPATRRGKYLAEIIRRQAVDGTGIRFNKDADKINAESKKNVDVLADEFLPYIVAEQQRRIELYNQVLTTIKNGESGITIVELRNKPPLIIRDRKMYRCPSNIAPKTPRGDGILSCLDNAIGSEETAILEFEPTHILYDSCLTAEDAELFHSKEPERFYFCNRPDTPETRIITRNGTDIIGCKKNERTSLKYALVKCVAGEGNDVVVHYRYYPDWSAIAMMQDMDPDKEICDNWNPCQIGYIFSLPEQSTAIEINGTLENPEDNKDKTPRVVPSGHVPIMLAALSRYMASETRCTRNETERGSDTTSFKRLPIPLTNSQASLHHAPLTSTVNGSNEYPMFAN